MKNDLSGKTCFVTGSSQGIGKEIARALGNAGGNIILHGKDTDRLNSVITEFKTIGIAAWGRAYDVNAMEDLAAFFLEIAKKYGKIDLLVNNAGVYGDHLPFWNLDRQRVRETVGTNLVGAMLTTQSALPLMPAGSKVINIGSSEILCGCRADPAYVASKTGLLGFTAALARDLKEKNIGVYMISPSRTMTDRYVETFMPSRSVAEKLEKTGFFTPVEEICDAVFLILDDLDGTRSGQNILVKSRNNEH